MLIHVGNYGNGSVIDFQYNQGLTRFEEEVFLSVLEKMIPFGGHPNAYVQIQNSIDLNSIVYETDTS